MKISIMIGRRSRHQDTIGYPAKHIKFSINVQNPTNNIVIISTITLNINIHSIIVTKIDITK